MASSADGDKVPTMMPYYTTGQVRRAGTPWVLVAYATRSVAMERAGGHVAESLALGRDNGDRDVQKLQMRQDLAKVTYPVVSP
jgi:hypothetical protein